MFTTLSIVVYYAKLNFTVVTNDPWFETISEICSTGRQVNSHLEELIINIGLQTKGMIYWNNKEDADLKVVVMVVVK
jgi:hypothetical protein